MHREFEHIKNNNKFLFPIFKESLLTDTGEINKLFKKIKEKFKYFNQILKSDDKELNDKEVIDIVISIMLDNTSSVYNSILKSSNNFKKIPHREISEMTIQIQNLQEKLIKKNSSIIKKKEAVLTKKKVELNKLIYINDIKDEKNQFLKNMLNEIDEKGEYDKIQKATRQLQFQGYHIFEYLSSLGFCYNHETKVKLNETDGYKSVPFIVLYDSYEDSTKSKCRFLGSLTEDDYIHIFMGIPSMIRIKEYQEIYDMLSALNGNGRIFWSLINDLEEKIQKIYNIIDTNNILFSPDLVDSVDKTVRSKIFKLQNLKHSIFSEKVIKSRLTLSIAAYKRIFLEIYQIINDNTENITTNNLRFSQIMNKDGYIYKNILLKNFYNLKFEEPVSLEELKNNFFKNIKKLNWNDIFERKLDRRDKITKAESDKMFDNIISYYTIKYYSKPEDSNIYMKRDGIEVNVSKEYNDQSITNKCSSLNINCDNSFIIEDDKLLSQIQIKELLSNANYLASDYRSVDDVLPDLALNYLKSFEIKTIQDDFGIYILESFHNWVERNIDSPSDNIWIHFTNLIELINRNPGILNKDYDKDIRYDEILKVQRYINVPIEFLDMIKDVKKDIDTNDLFNNVDIYLSNNINKKLKDIGFGTILKNLEKEFQTQIKTCLENNSTTLIPININYIGTYMGHTNMLSIHNGFVELVEPHGINMSMSTRYNQIYNYLTTFIDKTKIKRLDTKFIKSSLATSNLSPQQYEPLCTAHSHFYAVLRILYPSLPFHEIYTMTFSEFPINMEKFINTRDSSKYKDKTGIVTLNLPPEINFYDRQYIMFDNLHQDRIIRRLHNFILFNKKFNDDIEDKKTKIKMMMMIPNDEILVV
jgi:hypothetical protein